MAFVNRFEAECEARGVIAHPEGLVTRSDVERMARGEILSRLTGCEYLTEDLSPLRALGLASLIEAEVKEHAKYRHEARVEAVVAKLRLAAEALLATTGGGTWTPRLEYVSVDEDTDARLRAQYRDGGPFVYGVLSVVHTWYREEIAYGDTVAMLLGLIAIRGRGGHGDYGGPGGASELPILPWIRSHSGPGGAWISALREAVRRLRRSAHSPRAASEPESTPLYEVSLVVDEGGNIEVHLGWLDCHGSHAEADVRRFNRGILHPEVWRLLDHPAGVDIDGEAMPIEIRVPGHPEDTTVDTSEAHPLDVAGAIALGRSGFVSVSDR